MCLLKALFSVAKQNTIEIVTRRGAQPAGQARSTIDHLPPVCQHHPLDPGHLHDTRDGGDPGSPAQVLRPPGLGNHLQNQSAPTHFLQIPLMRGFGRGKIKFRSFSSLL